MKKVMMIITILLTLILAGALYGTHDQPEEGGTVTAAQLFTRQFPAQMPDTIIHPVPGCFLH